MGKLYTTVFNTQGLHNKHYLIYNSTIFSTPKFYFMQKFTLRIFMFLSLLGIANANLFAQTNVIANGGTYRQNFDTMRILANATLPQGWRIGGASAVRTLSSYASAGTTTTKIGGANIGSGSSDDGIYNFGAGTTTNGNGDRAVGGIPTNSNTAKTINVFVDLVNNGATPITDLNVSYNVEKYRNGSNADSSGVWLYYSIDGTTWSSAGAVIAYGHDANANGYSPAPNPVFTRFLSANITIASRPTNSHIYLMWSISVGPSGTGNNTNSAQGLAIDDIVVKTGAGGPAAGGPYFRTVGPGNWNDPSIWENSADNIAWAPAVIAPSYTDETITVRHNVTVTSSITIDQAFVNAGATLTINPSVVVTLNDGSGFDLTVDGAVSGSGSLIVTSTGTGTASIGASTGTISVPSTVQRFIPARRAWRFLSAPISTTAAPTINTAWQEGVGGNTTSNPNPGFGTHITGGSVGNGFDQNSKNNPSLEIYSTASGNATDQTNWSGISSTNLAITGQQGYMLFVRGDRSTDITQLTSAPTSNTVLRENGTLKIGDQNVALASNVYTVVGNPYAAPVDLNNLAKTNGSTNLADNYYIWDPKMTGTYGVGAYVNISWNGSSYDFTPVPTSPVSRVIQSGEAFFATTAAAGAGNVVIKESDKIVSGSDDVFRVMGTSNQNIRTNLYSVNSNGSTDLLDGTLNSYNSSFSDAIDQYDSKKLTNFGENIGIVRDGQTFIVERRQSIGDPINLKIWQMQQHSYQLQVVAENIDQSNGLTAFLNDTYLKTNTPLNLSGTTAYNFSITVDAASSAASRFVISFAKPTAAAPGNPSIGVYPNPVTNGVINLQMNNMPAGMYNVRVFNSMGQTVMIKLINHVAGNSTETIQVGRTLTKGVYQLDVIKPDNTKFSSKVIAN